jgi:glycosyltransferase involved in cell wall biosynthesis
MNDELELTILMPCLNEAETLETCINKAKFFLEKNNIKGEILIADNGSSDDSINIAKRNGARVEEIKEKGYGAALIGVDKLALGKYVIMGDADDSYNFMNLSPFLDKLREGYELVIGNRFRGGIEKNAMPPLHRYLGNPILSLIGRILYSKEVGDFHCGLRGYNRKSILSLNLHTSGMEYASEMIVQAALNKLKIAEVPTTLNKDGRTRASHLRSWRDGWRHLKYLLIYCPNNLFTIPGIICSIVGLLITILLLFGPLKINSLSLDIHTLLYSSAFTIIGINILLFRNYLKIYAISNNYIPYKNSMEKLERMSMEKGLLFGLFLILSGIIGTIFAFLQWRETGFSDIDPTNIMRITIPSVEAIIIGVQLISSALFINILSTNINIAERRYCNEV